MTKDRWIQRAKALLYDCSYCSDSRSIEKEIQDLLEASGGYDPDIESSETELKWGGE